MFYVAVRKICENAGLVGVTGKSWFFADAHWYVSWNHRRMNAGSATSRGLVRNRNTATPSVSLCDAICECEVVSHTHTHTTTVSRTVTAESHVLTNCRTFATDTLLRWSWLKLWTPAWRLMTSVPQRWPVAADCSPHNLGFNTIRLHTQFVAVGAGFSPTFFCLPLLIIIRSFSSFTATEMCCTLSHRQQWEPSKEVVVIVLVACVFVYLHCVYT